jgi:transcriptional antiterminator RfaH
VLRTKQAASTDAVVNVRNQNFEIFHPTFRRRPGARGVRRVSPLFPHYLMVRIRNCADDWSVLNNTRGVARVLLSGEQPARVPDRVVSDWRKLVEETDDGYYHDPEHDGPSFVRGDEVRGLRGLFKGKLGVYRGLAGNRRDRVRVLFSILGRDAEFELSVYDLAREVSLAA